MDAATRQRQGARWLLGFVAVSNGWTGGWATLAPESFYHSFPGLGRPGWVELVGPPSAHLTADVGAFYLAFAFLFAWAAWRPERALVVPLGVAFALFSLLHFGWHLAHLEPFSTGAAIAEMAALGIVLAAPLMAVGLVRSTPEPPPAAG